MTVASSTRKAGPFLGNGVTTAFPFTFKVFSKTDIQVVRASTTGAETTLVLDSNYSVVLNADQEANPGGTITYPISGTALASGETLTAIGSLPESQSTDLPNGGAFFAQTVEDRFDYLTILIQQLHELQDRGIRLPPSDTTSGLLPPPAQRHNMFLAFDANGAPSVAASVGTTVLSQSIIGTMLYPNAVFLTGADPSGTIDSTAVIQAALNTGKDVLIPSGTYKCNNLTQSTSFQQIIGMGRVWLQKNASGAHITASGADVLFRDILLRGDAASPTFTGDGFVLTGDNPKLLNCGSRWCPGRPVKATGNHLQLVGAGDIYQTTDATATGFDIEVGVSGTATLYHRIIGIKTGQSTGGIKFTDCGGQAVEACQFGKLTVAAGTLPSGVNGGNYTGNRVLNDVAIGISNAAFAANTFSNVAITFAGGTSGHSFDASNVLAAGATLTDSSTGSVVEDARQVALTAYTPVWTAASVNPAIGNGTITGSYTKRGRIVTVAVKIVMGSTTTFGTGAWFVSLPFAASTAAAFLGAAYVLDSGTTIYTGSAQALTDGTARAQIYGNNVIAAFDSAKPHTWANGDELRFTITYST